MPVRKQRKKYVPKKKKKKVPDLLICGLCRYSKLHVHRKGWNGCQCQFPGHPD